MTNVQQKNAITTAWDLGISSTTLLKLLVATYGHEKVGTMKTLAILVDEEYEFVKKCTTMFGSWEDKNEWTRVHRMLVGNTFKVFLSFPAFDNEPNQETLYEGTDWRQAKRVWESALIA